MDSEILQSWLSCAERWALHAGEIMLEARRQTSFSRQYKNSHELVTSTDLAVDEFLCQQIEQSFPAHIILSEESSPDLLLADQANVPVWVIDPIDGTVNFAHGLDHVAVSIAVYYQGQCQIGVVHAPFLEQTYTAIRGAGAHLNGQKISVSHASIIRNAVVATGFPYDKSNLPELIPLLSSILLHCQDIRRNGSAALDLCAVACGVLDAYYESVKPWDMAAGSLIAQEAGAVVGAFASQSAVWPEPINGDYLLVATPDLYQPIKSLLENANK